ncbi:methylated-DNA--[protein]-cysteine S-methyltransferase [Aureitalea sp. L0-47]|uniref:methylated-DNA--[protein]-cysteine S-methyltransferase n=1 Tax=Aureitalea sp. L0-47 TaxID=2816962 RepID=UPI0022377974|nr:methylated-DNA--[protein]-cysteine S-methyltransferase [Aureitalea sp. L0-47]MCW5518203.1 methylated-DNA--[protein]-cysteine S-methyltransferase [Aureitalea sp. L0-47]
MEQYAMETPLGMLRITGDLEGISEVSFVDDPMVSSEEIPKSLKPVVAQLREYFSKVRTDFELKLNPNGTDFQKRVWKTLGEVRFGRTKSYQEIANELGDPKVIRAAASANGKNPIAIIIPRHRVVGSDGSLTGYAGGLHRKKWLLEHESPVKQTQLF